MGVRNAIGVAALCGVMLLCRLASAGETPAAPAKGQAYALIVAGSGEEANFTENYRDWSVRTHALLTGPCGIPAANVKVLLENKELSPAITSAVSTKENVVKAFGELNAKITPADQFILVFIGHGTGQDGVGKLCLPGPDISSVETADWLDKIKAHEIVVVESSPYSATFLEKCSKPGRVIITSTNNSGEGNETYFMEFFLKAYEKNKDQAGALDLLSAFNSAATECPKWYLRQYFDGRSWRTDGKQSRALWDKFYGNVKDKSAVPSADPNADDAEPELGEWGEQWASRRMPTEHAQLDDNGDKVGTAVFVNNQFTPVAGSDESADGFIARKIILGKPHP